MTKGKLAGSDVRRSSRDDVVIVGAHCFRTSSESLCFERSPTCRFFNFFSRGRCMTRLSVRGLPVRFAGFPIINDTEFDRWNGSRLQQRDVS